MFANSSGLILEKEKSIEFHSVGIPVLVSSQLLRIRQLGQLDLCRVTKRNSEWVFEAAEVKTSAMGEEMLLRGQRGRIFKAGQFVAALMGAAVNVNCIVQKTSRRK